jgi:hypothetical protein
LCPFPSKIYGADTALKGRVNPRPNSGLSRFLTEVVASGTAAKPLKGIWREVL